MSGRTRVFDTQHDTHQHVSVVTRLETLFFMLRSNLLAKFTMDNRMADHRVQTVYQFFLILFEVKL